MIKGLLQTEHERVATLLSVYVDGRTSVHERALVERHLRTCTDCQKDLASLRSTRQAVRGLPLERVPRSFVLPRSMARQPRPAWSFPIFRTATAVVAMVFIVVLAGDLLGLDAARHSRGRPADAPLQVALQATASNVQSEGASLPDTRLAPLPTQDGLGYSGGVTVEQTTTLAAGQLDAAPLSATQALPAVPAAKASSLPGGQAPTPAQPLDATAVSAVSPPNAPPARPAQAKAVLLWRAIEIGLVGLVLLLGALALLTSGRVRQ